MTKELWSDILACAIAAENYDSSMSGSLAKRALRVQDWITSQEWDD